MPSVDLCCTPSLYEMKTHLVFNNQHVFVNKAANRHFNVYFKGYNNSRGNSLEACFTPDSMFVMIGELKQKPNVRITYTYIFIIERSVFRLLPMETYPVSCLPGSEDGRVHVWSTDSGMKVAVLDGKQGPINTLQFNPRFMTFASACSTMVS